jgi:hypothetical protein
LQWGLCGRSLAAFRILFGALDTIAHPLAHLWFVTQLHITGNLRRPKRTKAASIFVCLPTEFIEAVQYSHAASP